MKRLLLSGNILINENKEVFLLYKTKTNHLETPGGKVEEKDCVNIKNPTIEELMNAAERELKEELKGDYKIIHSEYLGKLNFETKDGIPATANKTIRIITGKPEAAEEIFDKQKSKFYKIEELKPEILSPDFPHFIPLINQYLKKLGPEFYEFFSPKKY